MYVPPEPGIAALNSLQIIPSGIAMSTAITQPSMACGPPSADMRRGIVMKGPIPIMFDMFKAVAWSKPKRRCKSGADPGDGLDGMPEVVMEKQKDPRSKFGNQE